MPETRLVNKLFSEQTYYNLQFFPLMIMLIPSMILMLINPFIFFGMMGGYFVYLVALKYAKLNYEQRYKEYRFIEAVCYRDDYHKPIRAWIDIDYANTFPLELASKDQLDIKLGQIDNDIQIFKSRRNHLLVALAKLKERKKEVKKAKKDKKKKKKKEKTKQDLGFDDEIDEGEEEGEEKTKEEKKQALTEAEQYRQDLEKELAQKKEIDAMEQQIDSKALKKIMKLDMEKIQKDIYKYDAMIDDLKIEKSQIQSDQDAFIKRMEEIRQKDKSLANWQFFRSKIMWSDMWIDTEYPDVDEVIFICPDNFDATFNFTNDWGSYAGIWFKVPNYCTATFIQVDYFQEIPYLLCVYSSWWAKNSKLTNIKKEIAEPLVLDAQIRQLADKVSKVQNAFKTLQFENLDLENTTKLLMNTIKRQEKRHKLNVKQLDREFKNVSWSNPPKPLYAITILGYILAVIFLLLFLLRPVLFPTEVMAGGVP